MRSPPPTLPLPPPRIPPRGTRRPPAVPAAVLGLFALGYAVQVATPLRLNNDVAAYLAAAGWILDGHSVVREAGPGVHPVGYPALAALVSGLRLDVSAVLVGLNAVAVGVAVAAAVRLYQRAFGLSARASWAAGALVPASFVVVKHATLGMADVLFLAVATAAVGAMCRAAGGGRGAGRSLAAAAVAVVAAFALRTTALALVPAVAVAAVASTGRVPRLAAAVRSRPVPVALGAAAALAALAWTLAATRYGQDGLAVYRRWGADALWHNVWNKLAEGGEVVLNAPAERLAGAGVPEAALAVVGALAAGVVGAGLWRLRRRRAAWPALAYVAAFAAMLVLWPGRDVRFWLGVWPVALGVAAVAVAAAPVWARRLARAAAVAFVAVGLFALALSVRISLAGAAFPDRYAGGTLAPVYRAAWEGRPLPDALREQDHFYHTLVRFDPHGGR